MITRRKLAGTLAPAILTRAAASGRPPNILFVLTDDQRWDTLGCYGNRIIQTPVMDKLAQTGVVFKNNFVTTAICAVSRASIFTGLYARNHGVDDFAKPLSEEDRPNAYYNALRKAGYRTGFIGKYGVGTAMPERDFDYWRGFEGQGRSENQRNGKMVHLTQIMTEQALEFVDGANPAQPFCLSISTKASHADDPDPRQYIPEPDLQEMYSNVNIPRPPLSGAEDYERLPAFLKNTEMRKRWLARFTTDAQFQTMVKNYYRLISGVDRMVGRVVQRLESKGLTGNTVVIYSSDNGYFLGERGMADKWMMYEPSIRTPLVIWDGRHTVSTGRRRSEMTLNIDVAPTLLDYAGLSKPPHVQGRSLRPLMDGGRWRPRHEWFYEHHYSRGVVIPRCEGVRTERWKYIRYIDPKPPHEELYDLRADRDEKNSRTATSPRELDRMRRRWREWSESLAAWRRGSIWRGPSAG